MPNPSYRTKGEVGNGIDLQIGARQEKEARALVHHVLRSQWNIITTRSMTALVESSEEKATREETLHSFGSGLSMTERKFDWT